MQSVVESNRLEVAERSAARRSLVSRTLFGAVRRVVRLDFFSLEDEFGRAVDRALAEFAREIRRRATLCTTGTSPRAAPDLGRLPDPNFSPRYLSLLFRSLYLEPEGVKNDAAVVRGWTAAPCDG